MKVRLRATSVALLTALGVVTALVVLISSGERATTTWIEERFPTQGPFALESPLSVQLAPVEDLNLLNFSKDALYFHLLGASGRLLRYPPKQEKILAHPTNYGKRLSKDIQGKPVDNEFIVVLHETVWSAESAINLFQTPHYRDIEQVSYHDLIKRDGTIINIVPFGMRAYGAGNSVFEGSKGPESVQTNPHLSPSVNNFAYHISLESPPEGWWEVNSHSGYTDAQYRSLAWLIARTNIPDSRITTHRAVDRSNSRIDPRSFDFQKFSDLLHEYRNRIGITQTNWWNSSAN